MIKNFYNNYQIILNAYEIKTRGGWQYEFTLYNLDDEACEMIQTECEGCKKGVFFTLDIDGVYPEDEEDAAELAEELVKDIKGKLGEHFKLIKELETDLKDEFIHLLGFKI